MCVCVYIYTYIYLYTHIYIYIHICIYIFGVDTNLVRINNIASSSLNPPHPFLDGCCATTSVITVKFEYALTGGPTRNGHQCYA